MVRCWKTGCLKMNTTGNYIQAKENSLACARGKQKWWILFCCAFCPPPPPPEGGGGGEWYKEHLFIFMQVHYHLMP